MLKLTLIIAMFYPVASYGFFGMLGRDQCGHQQTQFPTSSNDTAHAGQVQIQELETYRANLDRQMTTINAEGSQLQGTINGYFQAPWSDTMYAHMDNGLDCCAPTQTSAQLESSGNRLPAGQDLVEPIPYVEQPAGEVTNNQPVEQPGTVVPPNDTETSCNGYASQYCSNNWGNQTYSNPNTSGQLCLQTGFAATPAWYQAACRNGGQIDPQVCSNPRISRSPSDYQRCISAIDMYRQNAARKRQLASQIQEINARIQALRSPNRPQNDAYIDPIYANETKASSGNGFLSGLGSFLGNVVSTVGPFVLSQYLQYTAQKQASNNPLQAGPRGRLAIPNNGRNSYGPGTMSGSGRMGSLGYSQPQPQPPPPFYGQNYGYGMSYGGAYGQTLPGYQTGGFGCNTGMLGGGMNILAMLMGGGGRGGGLGGVLTGLMGGNANVNMNLNANLGGTFGANGGGAPYAAYQMGYGNTYPGVAPYTMGGYSPPYQPGGIYGGTPAYNPFYQQQAIPNYYTNQPTAQYTPTGNVPSYGCTNCFSGNNNNGQYLGSQYNSFYYAQQVNNQQRLAENEALLLRQQQQLNYQLMQLRMMNGTAGNTYNTGTNYNTGYTNGLTTPGYLGY